MRGQTGVWSLESSNRVWLHHQHRLSWNSAWWIGVAVPAVQSSSQKDHISSPVLIVFVSENVGRFSGGQDSLMMLQWITSVFAATERRKLFLSIENFLREKFNSRYRSGELIDWEVRPEIWKAVCSLGRGKWLRERRNVLSPWLGPAGVWSPGQTEVSAAVVPGPGGLLQTFLTSNKLQLKHRTELSWAELGWAGAGAGASCTPGTAWHCLAILLIFQVAVNCKGGFQSAFPAFPGR